MKKLISLVLILFALGSLFGQDSEYSDTIVRLGGRKMVCKIKNVGSIDVTYQYEGDSIAKKLERKQIERIIYANGAKEVFNTPVLMMVEETNWKYIIITDNPEEVQGLFERGKIDAISSPSERSKKAARKSAEIRLQKRAANKGGIMVLRTHMEFRGGYGEMPGYYMEGIVYGLEPLEEETTE